MSPGLALLVLKRYFYRPSRLLFCEEDGTAVLLDGDEGRVAELCCVVGFGRAQQFVLFLFIIVLDISFLLSSP